jgi:hypothetical protein
MLGALAPAPPDRIGALLTLYEFTARASADASTAVSEAASAAGAPRRIALSETMSPAGDRGDPAAAPEVAAQLAEAQAAYEPGKIEQTLRGLGITDTTLIQRGAQIDRAAEQLITQAAASHEPSQPSPPPTSLHIPQAARARDHQRESATPRTGPPASSSLPVQAEEAEAEPQ